MGEGSGSIGTKINTMRRVYSNQKIRNWKRIRENREIRI